MAGARVRVGGIVVALAGDRVSVDDGTATGSLQMIGDAADLLALLEPGDAVGAVGVVAVAGSDVLVRVDDPAGLVRLGDLGEALPLDPGASSSASSSVTAAGPAARPTAALPAPVELAGSSTAAPADPGAPGSGPLMAGVGLALLASSGWASFVAVRRRRDSNRLRARIAGRLAALAVDPPAGPAAAQARAPITAPPAVPEPTRIALEGASSAERGPTVREPA
jgi:hypothetical protein